MGFQRPLGIWAARLRRQAGSGVRSRSRSCQARNCESDSLRMLLDCKSTQVNSYQIRKQFRARHGSAPAVLDDQGEISRLGPEKEATPPHSKAYPRVLIPFILPL